MNESFDRSIKTAMQKMTGTYNIDTVYLVTANVISVDENAGTCSVETISGNASVNLTNVELQTVISDGLLIVPRVDSEVKVIYSKYTTPFIVQYSEIEKMYLSADLVQFDDGSKGGLVKVIDLTSKLNAIENKINNIITWGATVTPPLITTPLMPTQRADIENTNITQ
jgi:hypothetical protein